MQVLGIGIGSGIFNTFETLKSIEVLGIQYNFVRVAVLGIQYFETSIGSYPERIIITLCSIVPFERWLGPLRIRNVPSLPRLNRSERFVLLRYSSQSSP